MSSTVIQNKYLNATLKESMHDLNTSQNNIRGNNKSSSQHSDMQESSSNYMPKIELPKRKKNLNEVSSLYLSSESDEDENNGFSSRFSNINTFNGANKTISGGGGNRSMMSNYSSKVGGF